MKKYADYAGSSHTMSSDKLFIQALDDLFRNNKIEYILESGTFQGLGSTTTLAKAIKSNKVSVKQFYTVEVDYKLFKMAKSNLRKFPFITPLWGLTVNIDEAKDFLEHDEAIANHENYPEIFIDDIEDPKGFYINELSGHLSKHHKLKQNIFQKIRNRFNTGQFEYDIFQNYLPGMADKTPLVLLDSAGGIGYHEFNQVRKILGNNPYFLILDDINHLKHFRSYRDVKEDPRFTILNDNMEQGWLIAKYEGAES